MMTCQPNLYLTTTRPLEDSQIYGYPTLLEFNQAYFTTSERSHLHRIWAFFNLDSVDQTIDLIANHLKGNLSISSGITRIRTETLRSEIKIINASPIMQIEVLKLNSDDYRKFSFQALILEFHDKALLLSQMIRTLCCVQDLDCSGTEMSVSEGREMDVSEDV